MLGVGLMVESERSESCAAGIPDEQSHRRPLVRSVSLLSAVRRLSESGVVLS